MTIPEFIVFLLIMYVLINPLMGAYSFTHPPRLRISFRTPDDFGVPYEKVTLAAKDGIELKGWYILSRNGAAVILLHGHSGNRLGLMFHAERLVQAGYGVLMFDLRAHGSSGGRICARSPEGVEDVQTAVAFLSKRPDVQAGKIGVMGLSVGGLFALQAAARTIAICAIATDGPSPANMADMPPPRTLLNRVLHYPVQRYYLTACRWFGRQPQLPSTLSLLPRLKQPLLFISTGRGTEQRLVRSYYRAARSPKQLWEVPEAGHANGWLARPEEYAHHLVAFFDHTLMNKETPLPPTATVENFQGNSENLAGIRGFGGEEKSLNLPIPAKIAYDASLSLGAANLVALLMFPLAYALFVWPYQWMWGVSWVTAVSTTQFPSFPVFLLLFILSIFIHEGLHAIGYWWVGKVPRTEVKVGIQWKMLTPYAHCKAPLTATVYRIAVILPGLVLGILPGLLGVVTGYFFLVVWGGLMLVTAGGDAAILWAVRHVPGNALVLDHPTRAGCFVLTDLEGVEN